MDKQTAIINLDTIIKRIEKARLKVNNHHIVQLVAISKYSKSDDIKTLYDAGQRAFGENKVQDFKNKIHQLDTLPLSWHFVGSLQTNKINNLIDLNPTLFHGLDNLDLAYQLDKKLKIKNKTMNCLLQINSSKEDTKSGVMTEVAIKTFNKISQECSNIKLKGVMSIGANSKDEDIVKQSFIDTYDIFTCCKGATICSMGMSNDLELAIKCGSNMIRVGRDLFKV